MRSREKPGGRGTKGGRVEEQRREGRSDVGEPKRGGINWEAELPMALNQLAPFPGSLSGIREALREAGK